ncbi:hypothetical protein I553_3465 [Mycobacterium xenopi 4042]|uniref:Uncharacterized protein n=1 Tax=Mycobacterium xenopi 4042 TaxID=1299334 RepID=X7ZWJ6_MYCXE|nr:hypothetical protein I553_3465 [Mycobacterium xenopi 4042]EUA27949.1 hypothetical protein I552_0207 [Mycobacterium xenopi 3993]
MRNQATITKTARATTIKPMISHHGKLFFVWKLAELKMESAAAMSTT